MFEILKCAFGTLICLLFAIKTRAVVDLRGHQALHVVIGSGRRAWAQLSQQLLTVQEVVLIEHLAEVALDLSSQRLGLM